MVRGGGPAEIPILRLGELQLIGLYELEELLHLLLHCETVPQHIFLLYVKFNWLHGLLATLYFERQIFEYPYPFPYYAKINILFFFRYAGVEKWTM